MSKRYHGFKPDSRSEGQSDHVSDSKSRRFQEPYAGMDPRRRQELEDAGMIREDHRAVANLPQEVMIKPYPYNSPYLPEGLDDTIRGVDHQIDMLDNRKRQEHMFPKKV
jgi:hypothetical protein